MKTAGAYRILAVALLLAMSSVSWAANSKTQVGQVTSTVNVSGNEDYTVTSATPFANGGVVNIQNTDHAVLILTKVKPSAAIPLLAGHVQINGVQAVNGENCQVKMYGQGTIVLPYGDATKPLTVYSGQNFTGTAVNDFGLEDSGGFMNTLTAAKLNNQIRSFKLKRGYMVTFALRPGGYGYSRCFIAADQDLEVATLPDILDQKISSYRVFKWYDASKKGVAARGGNTAECAALNVTSTYSWGIGQNMGPDVECVPHHIKENWPVAADLGKATWSPHMKTNNEPQNTADDPWVKQSVDEILANWEGLMATGMRLCSPSSWDGSDYWNATGFLAGFFEEIDKRGWRCDIIDLHCYWPEANFGNIKNYADKFNRPVWVSEWVWGASWGDNYGSKGAFNDGVTESQNATTIQRICQQMNGMSYVERYFYWDDERDPTKLWKNGSLTTTGSTYSTLDCGLGYNGQKNYVPSPPPVEAPSKLTTVTAAGKVSLKWYEPNGELTQSMALEYSSNGSSWETVTAFDKEESPRYYTHELTKGAGRYRVHIVTWKGENLYSDVIAVDDASSYYLYNVGARQWICCANNWGTRASLISHGGHDVMAKQGANGKYTIDTQLQNTENENMHFLNVKDNEPWMDQVSGDWTITEVGSANGQPTYLLSNSGGQQKRVALAMTSDCVHTRRAVTSPGLMSTMAVIVKSMAWA